MTFESASEYLFSLGNEVSAMKLGLEIVRKLLAALGNPQNNYLKVQVAGTNGKGSVCAFLDSICNTAGVKTGTFTSPHLISITERIRINGIDINEKDFARHAAIVRKTAERMLADGGLEYLPTFFEQITAIALIAFAEAKVELAILETGLGGRLDATTAAGAEIAAITRIDYDHQEYLGETIEEIAAEKAAIIGEHTKAVVIGEQVPEAMAVVKASCDKIGIIPTTECESWAWAVTENQGSVVAGFRAKAEIYDDAVLGLPGRHQLENARTAVLIADVLRHDQFPQISADTVLDGLENARHPGRLEYQGNYLFDGAHNIGGAKALAEYLNEFETRPITLVFGAMRGKNVPEIFKILAPLSERIIVTEPPNSRSLSYEELLELLPVGRSKEMTFASDNVTSAIEIANEVTPADGIILITGSLYLVGEAKKILNN